MINFEALLESTCCKFTHFIVRSPCRIHLFLLRRLDLTKEGKRHVRNPVKSEFSEKLKQVRLKPIALLLSVKINNPKFESSEICSIFSFFLLSFFQIIQS